MLLPPPRSTLFPYTTLFRSVMTGFSASFALTNTGTPFAPLVVNTTSDGLARSEEHTSELQSRGHLVCRLLLEKKNYNSPLINLIMTGNAANNGGTARFRSIN